MKTFSIIFLIYLFTVCNSFSQPYPPEWTVTFNAYESSFDYPTKIAADSVGNVYVTGKSWVYDTEYDYLTVKYNTSGVFQWQARYNGPGNFTDEPTGIVVDKSGNVYVTGFSYGGTSKYDYATVKYNSEGVQQWVDRFNGPDDSTDKANSIVLDLSGNILVTGESMKNFTTYGYYFESLTIKYNSSGSRLWTRYYESMPLFDGKGKFIKCDKFGNSYVAVTNGEYWIALKYNSSGILQWSDYSERYPNRLPTLTSIEIDLNSSTYFIGYRNDSSRVVKFNSSGIKQWRKPYDFIVVNSSIDNNGNILFTGSGSYTGNYSNNIGTFKMNSSGIPEWKNSYNGIGNLEDFPVTVLTDISGNVYVSGYSTYPSTGIDPITIKYNSSGIKQWVSRSQVGELPIASAVDYAGNIYVTGSTIGLLTEYDYYILKIPNNLQLNATILMDGFYNEIDISLNRKDTLTAYLRNTTFPYSVVDSGKAIIDTLSFKCGFCFNNAPAGTYYIAIKHRNSIETWSKAGGEVFSKSSPVYYDFTSSASQAYGSNLVLKGSKYCMYSGNINQDVIIDASDQSQVDNDSFSGLSGSFLSSDVNGDNFVDATDVGIVDNNRSVVINRPYF